MAKQARKSPYQQWAATKYREQGKFEKAVLECRIAGVEWKQMTTTLLTLAREHLQARLKGKATK